MISVLMVDDHKAMLLGTKLLLEGHGMHVTVKHSGTDALELLAKQDFNIMIYDLKMPDMNGVELAKRTLKLKAEAIVLIFSGEDLAENYNLLVDTGVSGMLEKSASENQLVTAIHMALEGMVVLPLTIARQLRLPVTGQAAENEKEIEPLNETEVNIIQQAALGKTNKEISETFNMVQRNVEYHLSSVYRKLGAASRLDAIRKAIHHQIIKSK